MEQDQYNIDGPAFASARLLHAGKHWLVMLPIDSPAPARSWHPHDGPRLGPWHIILVSRGDAPKATARDTDIDAYREFNQLRAKFDRMIQIRNESMTEPMLVDNAEGAGWEAKGYSSGPGSTSIGSHADTIPDDDIDPMALPEGVLGRGRGLDAREAERKVSAKPSNLTLQAVYVEHAHRPTKAGVRACVHCIGLPIHGGPRQVESTMIQALKEWTATETGSSSMSAEPRIISTAGKGLRGCIPERFPYVYVGWRGGGLVSPLHDILVNLPPNFALDTLCGAAGWAQSRMIAAERSSVEYRGVQALPVER